jgi:hypothetical protein
MNRGAAFLLILTMLCQAGCTDRATPAPAPVDAPASDLIQAEPWPEADALFRTDPKWLGSDDAYSVDLGDGRVLWLFGDTFISTSFLNKRRLATMIRNSVAVQRGYDPSTASMAFYWRTENGRPQSFFPEKDETWFWPAHGIVLEDRLVIFLMATRATSEGLGFEHAGWRAVSIAHPERVPFEWELNWLHTPENGFGLIVSGSVMRMEAFLYAFSVREPDHTIHVVRWPVTDVLNDDLSRPEWWAGEDAGWVVQHELVESPAPLFADGQTEFTVHYEPLLERFLAIQTIGFGKADLGFRVADSLTGPWTPIERFHRPEEWAVPQVLIYAAKAHPHLRGADLVLTYATNITPFARLVRRSDLYYPRFLRVRFGGTWAAAWCEPVLGLVCGSTSLSSSQRCGYWCSRCESGSPTTFKLPRDKGSMRRPRRGLRRTKEEQNFGRYGNLPYIVWWCGVWSNPARNSRGSSRLRKRARRGFGQSGGLRGRQGSPRIA